MASHYKDVVGLQCPLLVVYFVKLLFMSNMTILGHFGWRGGLVVGRRTCDLAVVGSRPGRDAAA